MYISSVCLLALVLSVSVIEGIAGTGDGGGGGCGACARGGDGPPLPPTGEGVPGGVRWEERRPRQEEGGDLRGTARTCISKTENSKTYGLSFEIRHLRSRSGPKIEGIAVLLKMGLVRFTTFRRHWVLGPSTGNGGTYPQRLLRPPPPWPRARGKPRSAVQRPRWRTYIVAA